MLRLYAMLLIPAAADWLFHSKVTQTRAVDVDLDPEYASDFTKALGWSVGVCLVIIQSILSIGGLTMQRLSARENGKLPSRERISRWQRPMWVGGFCLFGIAQLINLPALTLTPMSIIGPLYCGTSILTSVLMSIGVTGEEYLFLDKIAIVLAFLGSVGAIVFGPHSGINDALTHSMLMVQFWKQPTTCVLVIVIGTFLIGCCALISMRRVLEQSTTWAPAVAISYPMLAAILAAISETFTKIVGMFMAHGMSYVGEHILLFTASFVTFVCTILLSLFVTSWAVERFDGRYYVPAYSVMQALFVTISGGFTFQEFDSFSASRMSLFVGSVLFCVASVLIGSQHSGVKPEESCDSVHEDEAIKTGSKADSNVQSESSIRSTKKGKVVTEKTPLVGRRPVNETSVGN